MKSTIKEVKGRYQCVSCDREWSGMASDDSIPEACNCNINNIFEKMSGDGSHCGLTDLYPEREKALRKAILAWRPFTTGWWASKKEIASARIEFEDDAFTISVSIYNDFDTEGDGQVVIPMKKNNDIDAIRELIDGGIYDAWELAQDNQKDNEMQTMYVIGEETKGKRVNWLDTYLVNSHGLESPTGDCYPEFGWQDGSKIPAKVKKVLAKGMEEYKDKIKCSGYIAELNK
jgi:hypothetical protein